VEQRPSGVSPPPAAASSDAPWPDPDAERLQRALDDVRERLRATEAERDELAASVFAASQDPTIRILRRGRRELGRHPLLGRLIDGARSFADTLAARIETAGTPPVHPLFDPIWYARSHQAIGLDPDDAWEHYLRGGRSAGHWPNALFDPAWYAVRYPLFARTGLEPLDHYLVLGAAQGLDPSPLFDTRFYLGHHPDVVIAGVNPLRHYLRFGWRELRAPHALFDPSWYAAQAPDLPSLAIRPYEHYLEVGGSRGLDPSEGFDSARYLADHPDVVELGMNPLAHYLAHGRAEGRRVHRSLGVRRPVAIPIVPSAPGLDLEGHVSHRSDERIAVRWAAGLQRRGSHPAVVEHVQGTSGIARLHRARPHRDADPARPPALPAPTTSAAAIAQVEGTRWAGATHLVLADGPDGWSQRFPELIGHLDRRYQRVEASAGSAAWDLEQPGRWRDLDDAIEAIRVSERRVVTVLDRVGGDGLHYPGHPDAVVLRAPVDRERLPYLDGSIDIVVVDDGDAPRIADARRVAAMALLLADDRGLTMTWQAIAPPVPPISLVIRSSADAPADAAYLARLDRTLAPGTIAEVLIDGARPPSGITSRLRSLPAPRQGRTARPGHLTAVLDASLGPLPGWLGELAVAIAADGSPNGAPDGCVEGVRVGMDGRPSVTAAPGRDRPFWLQASPGTPTTAEPRAVAVDLRTLSEQPT
jgi:hypothetical protein